MLVTTAMVAGNLTKVPSDSSASTTIQSPSPKRAFDPNAFMIPPLITVGSRALDPTVINGGIINALGSNARLGDGDWMVVEADESDGTFVKLPATIAVVTNIDSEHLDHYGTFDNLRAAARRLSKVP